MAKMKISQFIREQWATLPPPVTVDLTGQTVVVIGANTGIGFEGAQHFARMKPGKLILGCRNRSKGEAALSRLQQNTGFQNAELWMIDLAEFSSVKAFADKFLKEESRLDILVLNAAILPGDSFAPTVDGWESTLQVNCIAPSLLSFLLLPRMIQTAREHSTTPRLVVMGSEMHFWSTLDKTILESPTPIKDFGSKEYCSPKAMSPRYQDTKLLNILFARAFNDHLGDAPIIVNNVNPGYCYSEMRRNLTGLWAVLDWLMEKALARTAEEGSRQLIWAAVGESDKPERLRGAYVSFAEVHEPSDFVISNDGKKAQDHFWDDLVIELSKIDGRVRSIVDEYLVHVNST